MLCKRQKKILKNRACDLFLDCLDDLHIHEKELPNFDAINKILKGKTGWEILPVKGFIPSEDFFFFLAEKKISLDNFYSKFGTTRLSSRARYFS
jgi:phenylalanine-4-hydroxylase